jgi:hypothetical protein
VIEIPGVDHTTILDDDELQVTGKKKTKDVKGYI